jgi:L-rhamnose mutarotase
MEKIAFKMKLKKDCRAEYIRRHNEIWPELLSLLKDSGISDYTIFHDPDTDTLFAVQRQSAEKSSQDLGKEKIVQKWWKHMSDIMDTNNDLSPVSIPLERVFHMD